MTSRGMALLDALEALVAPAKPLCNLSRLAECHSDCCRALEGAAGRVVAVTMPDVVALATYLRQPRDACALWSACEEIISSYCTLSPFTGAYMLTGSDDNCPFLHEEGICTVYTVRPLLCRAFFHCPWIGDELALLDKNMDRVVVDSILRMAQELACYWPSQPERLWREPLRYDELILSLV